MRKFLNGLFCFLAMVTAHAQSGRTEIITEEKLNAEKKQLEQEKKRMSDEQKALDRERKEAKEKLKDLLAAQNKAESLGDKNAAQKARQDLIAQIADSQTITSKIESAKLDLESINQQLNSISVQLSQLREKPIIKPDQGRTLAKLLQDITRELQLIPTRIKSWFVKRTGQPDTEKNYTLALTEVMKIEAEKPFVIWSEREKARNAQLASRIGSPGYDPIYNAKLRELQRTKTDYVNQKIDNYRNDSKQLQQDFALLENQRLINADPQMPVARLIEKQQQALQWKQSQPAQLFSDLFAELTPDKVYEDILGRKNPYTVLGIDQDATQPEIEKIYQSRSTLNKNDEAQEAYNYLTSPDLRNLVDSTLDFSTIISREMINRVRSELQEKYMNQSNNILNELNRIIKDRQSNQGQPSVQEGPGIPPM